MRYTWGCHYCLQYMWSMARQDDKVRRQFNLWEQKREIAHELISLNVSLPNVSTRIQYVYIFYTSRNVCIQNG